MVETRFQVQVCQLIHWICGTGFRSGMDNWSNHVRHMWVIWDGTTQKPYLFDLLDLVEKQLIYPYKGLELWGIVQCFCYINANYTFRLYSIGMSAVLHQEYRILGAIPAGSYTLNSVRLEYATIFLCNNSNSRYQQDSDHQAESHLKSSYCSNNVSAKYFEKHIVQYIV